jgi:hypothetical protein
LLTIWRAATAKTEIAVCLTFPGDRFEGRSRPIVGKPDSYALRAEATLRRAQILLERGLPAKLLILAAGVGAQLAFLLFNICPDQRP